MIQKQKYDTNNLSKIGDSKDRIAKALIFVANELHNIYCALKKIEK